MVSQNNSNKIEVSIIIPTFNRPESLIRTLDSLFNQTFSQEKFEINIVDGSSDDTEKIVLDIKKNHSNINYIKQLDKGAASARNQGIYHSKGDILGFTDDDCVVDSSWIENAVITLQNRELCGVQGITLPEKKLKMKNKLLEYADVATYTGDEKYESYPTCNIFYRKKDLVEISGLDQKLTYGEDDDLAFRLIKKGKKIILNKNIIVYHEVRYISLYAYISKRLKRRESLPLFVKKHPEYRDRLFLKIFIPSHLYIILLMGTCIMYLLNMDIFIPLFLTILAFLVTRVFIDRNYKMMIGRILFFWRYFIIDSANVYYLVKGSIIHRSLMV